VSQQLFIDGAGHPSESLVWALKTELTTTFLSGSLNDIAVDEHCSVVLVLSGLNASLLNASMPTRNKQKTRQALPFLFEDQLIEDAQSLHFAIGPLKSDQLNIAVIEKQLLQDWLDALSGVGIQLEQAVIDTQLLSVPVNGWAVWCDENTALVRIDNNNGFACDREQLVDLLAALPAVDEDNDNDDQIVKINHLGELDLFPFTSNFPDKKIVDQIAPSRFEFVIGQYNVSKDQAPINLLQAQFAQSAGRVLPNKLAAIAASVVLLAVVGYSSLLIYQNNQLENQYVGLQEQMTLLYKSTFPKENRVIDAKVQMQGHLKKLQGTGNQTGGLLHYLATVAQVSGGRNSDIDLKQLRYNKNSLELKFETDSLKIVEQFRNKIHKKGLTTKVLSANKDSGRVKAKVKIGVTS